MRRVGLLLVGLLALVASTASVSSGAKQQTQPVRLLAAPNIAAFAQDGSRIAWVAERPDHAYDKPATCATVWLRDLQTGRTTPLASPARVTCIGGPWESSSPQVMNRMALAGTQALWGAISGSGSISEVWWDKAAFSAAPGEKERLVGTWECDIYREQAEVSPCDVEDRTGLLATGDGQETFYIDEGSYTNVVQVSRPPVARVYMVDSRRTLVPSTTGALWISAGGGRLAVLRKTASGRVVQIQSVPSGAMQTSFKVSAHTSEVACDGSALALKSGSQIEIRQPSGARRLVVAVPASAQALSLSAGRLVYFVGRQILMLDTRSGKTTTLARAKGTIVGLSIDGRRVAWAERSRGIFSLTVS